MDLAALFRDDMNAAQSRASDFSTMYNAREKHLSDLYKQKLESDRYAQLTPHEVNIKALEGDRAKMMNTPEMRDAYGMGQLGMFGEQFAKGTKALGTLDSDITAGNAENNQKTMTALITKFSQMADFADAAHMHGGDQAVIANLPPEIAEMYQKELATGKSGKEIINGFRTKIGQVKDQMMRNASYDPKYYAEERLHRMDNDARLKEAGIRASSAADDRAANPNQWKLVEQYTILTRQLKVKIDQMIATGQTPPKELLEQYGTAKKILNSVTNKTTYSTNPYAGMMPGMPTEIKKTTVMGQSGSKGPAPGTPENPIKLD